MKWVISALIVALLTYNLVVPAFAKEIDVPGDSNGDKIVSAKEMKAAEMMAKEGKITAEQLEAIRNINDNYPKTIMDSANNTITIYKPIQRVAIAYFIGGAIVMQALKAEDLVVGVTTLITRDPILFPKLSKLPEIGMGPNVDYLDFEKILALKPDVVITGGKSSPVLGYDEIQKKIQSLDPDIIVLRFDYCQPKTFLEEVNKTGYILDKEQEADEVVSFFKDHLNLIQERVDKIPSDKQIKVYSEVFKDFQTGGKGSYYPNDYIDMAGGINIFGDSPQGVFTADAEEIIERNPEIILCLMSTTAGEMGWGTNNITAFQEKRKDIMIRPGFDKITASKNGKVYILMGNLVIEAFYPIGLSYYAKWFYPELFKDLDPIEVHKEYMSKVLHIDYDPSKQGAFVYHPEQNPNGR